MEYYLLIYSTEAYCQRVSVTHPGNKYIIKEVNKMYGE